MFNAKFNLDRAAIIALAMVATLPFLALSPADAATADCTAEVQAIKVQAQADGISPNSAAKALRTARIGEKICAEGSRYEAAKKFAAARAQLDQGVQYADRR
jgi:membrane-bound lytic murein transglycosylase B